MKIGFALPVSGSWANPDTIVHVARRADELGYHSAWTFQRLLCDVEGTWGQTYRSVIDPLTTLAYAAAITRRVRLGVAVINLPFISPTLLAKQAATLDVLSEGRLDLGLGLGWADEEFRASGAPKDQRGRRAEDFIATLRTLWTDDVVEHDGPFYQIPRSRMAPQPIQRPHPPILLGGAAPSALRRAGRIADGWISSSRHDLTTIGDAVAAVGQAARQAGRDVGALRFVCRGLVRVEPSGSTSSRTPLVGSLDEIRADMATLSTAGITELFIDLNFDPRVGSPDADPTRSRAMADDLLEAFAPAATMP